MSEGNRDYVGEALKRVSSSPEAATSTATFNGGDYPALGDNTAAQQPVWKVGSFSAKELQKMTFPPLSWVIPNIIPAEGVTLLCSKPKFGKSWLAYDLCIACTTDRFTLGTVKPAQGNVLYLALEDSKRRLQRRMTKLLPTFGSQWPDKLLLKTEWRRLHEGGLEDIRDWHDHTRAKGGKPILVVIDVLAKVRKPVGNRQLYEADYAALADLTKLANELGLAIVVLHHTRKMAADPLRLLLLDDLRPIGRSVQAVAGRPKCRRRSAGDRHAPKKGGQFGEVVGRGQLVDGGDLSAICLPIAVALLHRAQEVGLRIEPMGKKLLVRGPKRAEAVVKLLAEHKAEVLAALSPSFVDASWWRERFAAKAVQWFVGDRDWEAANRLAWGDLENEWHYQHGKRWPTWQCARSLAARSR
jgi:AAA domain